MTKVEKIKRLKKKLREARALAKDWEKCAQAWMRDYDRLKDKHEPAVAVFLEQPQDHKRGAKKKYKDQFG